MKARRTGTVHHIVDEHTASVHVERLVRHPKYGKSYRRTTKLLVDVTPARELAVGAVVLIEATRPISKQKSFRIVEVYSTAVRKPISDDILADDLSSDLRPQTAKSPEEIL